MSREIKFRAWDKSFGKIIKVTDLNLETGYLIGEINTKLVSCKFVDCELMQYTDIKDTYGTEIYESYFVEDEHGKINLVRYKKGLLLIGNWNAHGFMNAFTEFKVIGNIYENSELLEVTK